MKIDWINSRTRLPPYEERVLIASKIGGQPAVYVGFRTATTSSGEVWSLDGITRADLNVEFWMPLPPVPGISE